MTKLLRKAADDSKSKDPSFEDKANKSHPKTSPFKSKSTKTSAKKNPHANPSQKSIRQKESAKSKDSKRKQEKPQVKESPQKVEPDETFYFLKSRSDNVSQEKSLSPNIYETSEENRTALLPQFGGLWSENTKSDWLNQIFVTSPDKETDRKYELPSPSNDKSRPSRNIDNHQSGSKISKTKKSVPAAPKYADKPPKSPKDNVNQSIPSWHIDLKSSLRKARRQTTIEEPITPKKMANPKEKVENTKSMTKKPTIDTDSSVFAKMKVKIKEDKEEYDSFCEDEDKREKLYQHILSNMDKINELKVQRAQKSSTLERNREYNKYSKLVEDKGFADDFWIEGNDLLKPAHSKLALKLVDTANEKDMLAQRILAKDLAMKLDSFLNVKYSPQFYHHPYE